MLAVMTTGLCQIAQWIGQIGQWIGQCKLVGLPPFSTIFSATSKAEKIYLGESSGPVLLIHWKYFSGINLLFTEGKKLSLHGSLVDTER